VVALPSGERLAVSTDSFVVRPWRFPGGSIGSLAVHGTVNDLAVAGARPAWLSVGFVLEEGLPIEDLRAITAEMGEAAARAGVEIVTGDTKVVEKGPPTSSTSTPPGSGVPAGRASARSWSAPGTRCCCRARWATTGSPVMLARGDLHLDADVVSDSAPLAGLVEAILAAAPGTRWLRDATRGGVGTVVNELAAATQLGVVLAEQALPVRPPVAGACDLLGIDPLYVANEGKLVAVVPAAQARRRSRRCRRTSTAATPP
jgi:hydrogenase expression/formation protein HypE